MRCDILCEASHRRTLILFAVLPSGELYYFSLQAWLLFHRGLTLFGRGLTLFLRGLTLLCDTGTGPWHAITTGAQYGLSASHRGCRYLPPRSGKTEFIRLPSVCAHLKKKRLFFRALIINHLQGLLYKKSSKTVNYPFKNPYNSLEINILQLKRFFLQ